MAEDQLHDSVDEIRKFNRFYTKRIGLLNRGILKTRFPLIQARVIFELAQHEQSTARDLINELDIDPGYLSRILTSFEKDGLVRKVQSKSDNRQWFLKLTSKGRRSFSVLNDRSRQEVRAMLKSLSGEDQRRLLNAIHVMEEVLGAKPKPITSYLLRPHRPGDIGWITHRHGVLYSEEYGFDETFEALVAEILAGFIRNHDHKRERIWIAEQDGERVGCVMIADAGNQVAQLRLFLVEPKARGKGIGKRLIDECIDFSRRSRYQKIKLWTQSILLAARHLYSKAGFERVEEKPHTSFGHDLIAEVWELQLRG
jgi:DNA-binding MarR family transcriptional regulator/N-acetylglutamate synthase-like GNAT family acetyltransferase